MSKQIISLPDLKQTATGFNHAIKAGQFIFLSSQLSMDLTTGQIIKGNITAQTKRAMDNIQYILKQCDCSMNDIIKVTIYFRNLTDRQKINQVYKTYFSTGQQPAKTSVQAVSPIAGVDLEIEAVAYKE